MINNNNLLNISDFSKTNNHFSDYNLINNFLLDMDFIQYRSNNTLIQSGGSVNIPFTIPEQQQQQELLVLEKNKVLISNISQPFKKLYIIKKGTILYHNSSCKNINKNVINIHNMKLKYMFTPYFKLAINNNLITKHIEIFEVIHDIPILMINIDDIDSMTSIETLFLNGTDIYMGIGFYYPKNPLELETFNMTDTNSNPLIDENNFYVEFALDNSNKAIKLNNKLKYDKIKK
jgi:hypothetical protein